VSRNQAPITLSLHPDISVLATAYHARRIRHLDYTLLPGRSYEFGDPRKIERFRKANHLAVLVND
jgi:hypothetical protein